MSLALIEVREAAVDKCKVSKYAYTRELVLTLRALQANSPIVLKR